MFEHVTTIVNDTKWEVARKRKIKGAEFRRRREE
jgi:hypothetical protein